MADLASFYRKYCTENRDLTIHGRQFTFVVPKKIDQFIDVENIVRGFPLWAKIWEPSWILAEHVANTPPFQFNKILEIGSGIGVVGIVAASFGHDVTMTEYDENALQFASANAEINHCSEVKICRLDWHHPDLDDRFDTIIGSEVMFHERDCNPLLNLCRTYLKPNGRVIFASGVRQSVLDILNRMRQFFDVKINKYSIRSEASSMPAVICHMSPRE
jgi:2-polyprenyl-3-methyl-5-hydroxy-6-metoxy-1,4-benzoquinol methylase